MTLYGRHFCPVATVVHGERGAMAMDFVGKVFSGVKGLYNDINPSTLSGAIDIIVVEQVC